ncbi:MAG: hypothetical protein ABL904_10095 [Hyphomicrobiaceae bacterium]
MTTKLFAAGGYRYIPAVFQYSGGVVAEPGFQIERVRFQNSVPLADGFRRIEQLLTEAGRPLTSFCACELRSPEPFTEAGFIKFNELYVGTLARWGLYDVASKTNPVARSNVCPEIHKPVEPSFHAFCYTVPVPAAMPTFVVAGSGEAPEGKGSYGHFVVRPGDTSADGMREKARAVLSEMERRMGLLGHTWKDTTAAQVYTVFDIHPFLANEVVRRGAAEHGLTWHFCRPPVVGLDYEMDCRAVRTEHVIA